METVKNKPVSQLRAYATIAWYTFLASARSRGTFIFGFIFPIVFIGIFGLIGGSGQKYNVGLVKTDQFAQTPVYQALSGNPAFNFKDQPEPELEKQLKLGKIDGIIKGDVISVDPPKYSVTTITTSGNPMGAAAVSTIVSGIVDKFNLQLAGVAEPPISLNNMEISGRKFRFIDFALPGQIGFSILSTAIFSTVFGFIALKRMLVLKRMFATPTRPITILLAQASSRLVFALLQTALILIVGVLVFHFYLPHGWVTFFEMLLLSTIGLIAFLGFGFFIAGLANDENAAGPLVNLITLPQFLLSGTFFSTESFPNWLQPIANNLPLSYFNIAARKIATEGASMVEVLPYLVGILAWGAVMYFLATRTFKWE